MCNADKNIKETIGTHCVSTDPRCRTKEMAGINNRCARDDNRLALTPELLARPAPTLTHSTVDIVQEYRLFNC